MTVHSDSENSPTAVRVRTGARLHFGLLRPVHDGTRVFGGVGMMVDSPPVVVQVDRSARADPDSPILRRLEEVHQRWKSRDEQAGQLQVRLLQNPPLHSGLGTGTQLALAASLAIAQSLGKGDDRQSIMDCSGRGRRSAVGVYGFFHGGLIVDGGSTDPRQLGELAGRAELPPTWRVLLVRSRREQHRMFGLEEEACFTNSLSPSPTTGILERLLLEELFPAAKQGDFATFQQAVSTYNRLAGSLFAAIQGGPYHGPVITELVHRIGGLGPFGVGQSSWGPTVFAICEDLDRATWLDQKLSQNDVETQVVRIFNGMAEVVAEKMMDSGCATDCNK